MSQLDSKSHPGTSRDETEIADGDAPASTASGRPKFDRRGTTVWEWQTATGVFSQDASTTRVQRLQVHDLSIEKTAIVKQVAIDEPRLNVAPCGGINPYDHAPARKTTPIAVPQPVAMARARRPPTRPLAMPPRRPITLLERLRALFAGK